MAFAANNNQIGVVDLTAAYTTLGIPGLGQLPSVTTDIQTGAVVSGWDPSLGGGEFMFAKSTGTIAAGTVVQLSTTTTGGVFTTNFTAWAGTANSGAPLGVAMAATTVGQYCWIQVEGNAIATCQGAPVAGNPAYYQAAGVVSPTVVASKQVLNAQFASAPAVTVGSGTTAVVLSATQALLFVNRPVAQGAIT